MKTNKKSNEVVAKTKKPNVGIMTHATFEKSGQTPLNIVISAIGPLTNRLFIITGGEFNNSTSDATVIRIKAQKRATFGGRVWQQGLTHVRQMRVLFKLRKEVDILIFYFGTPFPLPLVFAQGLGIKCFIILAVEGSGVWGKAAQISGSAQQFSELFRFRIQEVLERISYHFADKLIAYGPSMVDSMRLNRYVKKIAIFPPYVSDYDAFDIATRLVERHDLIGYVGRLNEEKGILNLINAIPQVLQERPYSRFMIIGDGRLCEEIRKSLDHSDIAEYVRLVRWVSHEALPGYLNRLKLLVLPSYTEGLPNVMLEAMACGTLVLATRVGAVPDVIEDGKTGFLMDTNTPGCIARDIIRAISYPDIQEISENAYVYVRKECTRDKACQAWRKILK